MNRDLTPAEWTLLARIARSTTGGQRAPRVDATTMAIYSKLLLYRLIERGDKEWQLTNEGHSLLDNAVGRRRRDDTGPRPPS